MIHLRALLLDFDGLLVDTEPLHFRGFRDAAAAEGVRLNEDVYFERYVGFDDRDGFAAIWHDAGRPVPAGAELDALMAAKAGIVERLMRTELEPRPGAAEFVRTAATIYRLGICSGALRAEVELGLSGLGLGDLGLPIVAADDVARSKPDPEGYRMLMDRLNADAIAAGDPPLDASLCAALEDTTHGLESARGAGVWAVAVAGTEPPALLQRTAHLVLSTLRDVHPADLAELLSVAVEGPAT